MPRDTLGTRQELEPAEIFREAEYQILLTYANEIKKDGLPQISFGTTRKVVKIINDAEEDALDEMALELIDGYADGYMSDPKHNTSKSKALLGAIALFGVAKTLYDKMRALNEAQSWMTANANMKLNQTINSVKNAANTFRLSAQRAQIGLVDQVTENFSSRGMTLLQAKQAALDLLAKNGITSFTDRAGRRWQIDSYVEMCSRTAHAAEYREAFLDSLDERGKDLVYVSAHAGACPLCVPWEGMILSRTGNSLEYESLDAAEGAGLFHPNCGHMLFEYQEGYSKLRKIHNPENAQLYKDRQTQRGMEREIRRCKREQAVALTADARKDADAKLKAAQERIRTFVSEKGLVRKYDREKVWKGNK